MPRSRPWAARRPRASSPNRRPPARSFWASPRPPCRVRALFRLPASRKPRKCSPRPSLAGKIDRLVGLKETVILGHLIPAGTGFRTYQDSEVRIRPQPGRPGTRERRHSCPPFPLIGRRGRWSPPKKALAFTTGPSPLDELFEQAGIPDDEDEVEKEELIAEVSDEEDEDGE